MATLQEVKDKLAEYEAQIADRTAKQGKHEADVVALTAAIDTEAVSKTEWLAALRREHELEDELEALVVAHEPPVLPE